MEKMSRKITAENREETTKNWLKNKKSGKSHCTIGKHCFSDRLLEKSPWVGLETTSDCRRKRLQLEKYQETTSHVGVWLYWLVWTLDADGTCRIGCRKVLLGFDLQLMMNFMVVLVFFLCKKRMMQNIWASHRIIEARWLCNCVFFFWIFFTTYHVVIVSRENIIKMRELIFLRWTLFIYKLYTILNTYLPIWDS